MFQDPENLGIVIGTTIATIVALFVFYATVWRKVVVPLQKALATLGAAFETTGNQPGSLMQSVQTTVQAANAQQEASILGKFDQYIAGQNNLIRVFEETNRFKEGLLLNLQKEFTDFKNQAQTDKAALQTQIDAQCVLLDKQTARIDTLQTTINEKDKVIQAQNETIAERDEQLKDIEALKGRVAELEKKVDLMLEEKEKLLAERDQALRDLQAVQSKLDEVTKERDDLKAERDELALRVAGQAVVIDEHITKPITEKSARADIPPNQGVTAAQELRPGEAKDWEA